MQNWFEVGAFLPHGVCFLQRPELIWLHVISDLVIAIAYFMIPITLSLLLRRMGTRMSFNWAVVLFAAFIMLCGVTHVFGIITVWLPLYYLEGWLKAMTAAVSLATAVAIIPLVPKLLRLRMPEELEAINGTLRAEIRLRENAEADRVKSMAELNQAVRELEQFAYITSHDLQAPLRNISGFSQLLTRRYSNQLDGDAQEFLGFIDQGVRQMRALINDLLALSRVGRSEARFEPQPLRTTVNRALAALRSELERTAASVEIGELPEIEAEHNLLVQLFQNLIANAIKFQRPGRMPKVTITAQREGDRVHLVIRDNGIGIPPDQLEQIFAIFRRLHPAEEFEGTGIGLAICRKIVQHHGGEIWAESAAEGSSSPIPLPLVARPLARSGAGAEPVVI